jgi:hypothetical protein
MNEMKDLLQLRLDTPTVDRSVSVFHGVRLRFANVTSAYTIPEFHLLLLPTYPSSVRPFFRPLAPQTESFLGEAVPFVPFFNNCFFTHHVSSVAQFGFCVNPRLGFQLKPVRSLENFKQHSSPPSSSPDRWVFPSRTGAPMASPPKRFFLPNQPVSQDTQNLLQSPDDVFSSPPVPPRAPSREAKDLFGTTPFVVGGGHSENGDPLFLVANQHSVDIVKLSPPTCSPRRKVIVVCRFGACVLTLNSSDVVLRA